MRTSSSAPIFNLFYFFFELLPIENLALNFFVSNLHVSCNVVELVAILSVISPCYSFRVITAQQYFGCPKC